MSKADQPARVGGLIKAKEIERDDVAAAIAAVFDGKTALPLPGGYGLILPDLAKMTPYSRKAIMTALIEATARGCECLPLSRRLGRGDAGRTGLSN